MDIQRALNDKLGIPSLIIDGDHMDSRETSLWHSLRRARTRYMEMLLERKSKGNKYEPADKFKKGDKPYEKEFPKKIPILYWTNLRGEIVLLNSVSGRYCGLKKVGLCDLPQILVPHV